MAKRKILQDKQLSTNITQTSKGRESRTPLSQGANLCAIEA
jgi:hypothetical protein